LHLGAVFFGDPRLGPDRKAARVDGKPDSGRGTVGVNGSACDWRIDPVFVRGRGEQTRFSDMNHQGTAPGVDSPFRWVGAGDDNDRHGHTGH
jgi:hypothetical protein